MVDAGAITAGAGAQAAAAQIAFPPTPPIGAGWFADWAADQAQPLLPPGADAVLRTTLDARLQAVVEARLAALLDGPGRGRRARARARWWCWTPRPARCAPWSAAATTAAAPTTAPCWRGASPARRSSRSSGWRRWRTACGRTTRCWTRRSASAAGARRISSGRFRGEITLEEALAESHQHRLGAAAAAGRRAARGGRGGAPAGHRRHAAGQRLAGARHRRGGAAGDGRRLCGVLQRRQAGDAVPASTPSPPTGAPSPLRRSAAAAVIDPDMAAMMARMLAAVVARGSGRAAAAARAHGRRQDRHHAGLPRRLVHRLRSAARSSACGSATTTTGR